MIVIQFGALLSLNLNITVRATINYQILTFNIFCLLSACYHILKPTVFCSWQETLFLLIYILILEGILSWSIAINKLRMVLGGRLKGGMFFF